MNRRGEAVLLLRDEGFIATIFARRATRAIGLESKMWARSGWRVSGAVQQTNRRSSSATGVCMALIPQGRLRNEIGAVLRRAEQGERFTVTVAGRPAAELGPLPGARSLAPPERLRAILAETPPDPGFAEELRRMRQQDRESARDPWAA
jgi:antitoxin (DNA-binding transcriptional repressor) of toxin-antitoxin stability system